jgi:hypothetical protein
MTISQVVLEVFLGALAPHVGQFLVLLLICPPQSLHLIKVTTMLSLIFDGYVFHSIVIFLHFFNLF